MNDSLFSEFAQVAERIAATPKRLEKAAMLGEYCRLLDDDDLALAARYFAGYLFSLCDQRVVNVGNGHRSKVLSDYTFAVRAGDDDATLLNVGKAYSGLTDIEIAELSEWFRAHTIQEFAHGKVRTVEPQVVIEVTFDRVQASVRHKSGYALRFPRILRVRGDKPAGEIDTLETVKKLAESES